MLRTDHDVNSEYALIDRMHRSFSLEMTQRLFLTDGYSSVHHVYTHLSNAFETTNDATGSDTTFCTKHAFIGVITSSASDCVDF